MPFLNQRLRLFVEPRGPGPAAVRGREGGEEEGEAQKEQQRPREEKRGYPRQGGTARAQACGRKGPWEQRKGGQRGLQWRAGWGGRAQRVMRMGERQQFCQARWSLGWLSPGQWDAVGLEGQSGGQGDTERPRINHPETGARGQGEGGAMRTERSWTDGRGSVREET